MKVKIISVIACGFLALGLAGCNNSSNNSATSQPAATTPQVGQNNPGEPANSNTKVVLSKNMVKCSLKDAASDGSLDAQASKPMLTSYAKKNGCTNSVKLLDDTYMKAYKDAKHHMIQ